MESPIAEEDSVPRARLGRSPRLRLSQTRAAAGKTERFLGWALWLLLAGVLVWTGT